VDFDVEDQQLIKFSESGRCWRKKLESNGTVHQLLIHFKKACNSVKRKYYTVFSLNF
jgi:hypothetical protein